MKFVNKLSVISLIVLMFSFINIGHAGECVPNKVDSCASSKTQALCEQTYRWTDQKLCKWDGSTCRANGANCYRTTKDGQYCRETSNCDSGYTCGLTGDANGGGYCKPKGETYDVNKYNFK
jgi:hypothetical protein